MGRDTKRQRICGEVPWFAKKGTQIRGRCLTMDRFFDGTIECQSSDASTGLICIKLNEELRPLSPEPGFQPLANPLLPGQINAVGSVFEVNPGPNVEFLVDTDVPTSHSKMIWPDGGCWHKDPTKKVMAALLFGSIDDVEFASESLKVASKWPLSAAVAKFFFNTGEFDDDAQLKELNITDDVGKTIATTFRDGPDAGNVLAAFGIVDVDPRQRVFRTQWGSFDMRPQNLPHIYDLIFGKLHCVKQSPRNQQLQKFVRRFVQTRRELYDTLQVPSDPRPEEQVAWLAAITDGDDLKALWTMPGQIFDAVNQPLKNVIALSDDPERVQKAIPLVLEPGSDQLPLVQFGSFGAADSALRPIVSVFRKSHKDALYPKFGVDEGFITDAVDRAMVCGAAGLSVDLALSGEQKTMICAVSSILGTATEDGSFDVVQFLAVFEKELLGISAASTPAFMIGLLIQELFSSSLWYDSTMDVHVGADDVLPMKLLISILQGKSPVPILCDNVHPMFLPMISQNTALNFIVTDNDKLVAAFYTTNDAAGQEWRVQNPNMDVPYVAFKFSVVANDLSDFSIPATA